MTRLVAGVAFVVAVVAIVLAATRGGSDATASSATSARAPDPVSATTPTTLTINQIYRRDGPGVVDIKVKSTQSSILGPSEQTEDEGAGVVYNTKGDILTDEHVVKGATSITVTFEDGDQRSAKLVGTDASTDVGVIHVDAPASDLHPIPFIDAATAQVGNPVVAIGSPFGLPETVTSGIVSAVGRSITAPNGYTITGAIQTDAPINPGNSGGPLLNSSGDVLGLADQIDTENSSLTGQGSSSGVGFATPSTMVAQVANKLIAGKPVRHAYLGVLLNAASTGGAQITAVEPGSPAAHAGLRRGDLVTAIDGKAITSTQQLIETIGTDHPGQRIRVTVKRGTKTIHLQVTLGTQPQTQPNG